MTAHPPSLRDIKTLLINGFIAPFTDVPLKSVYLATLIHGLGFSIFDMFFVVDYASMGVTPVIQYLSIKFTILTFTIAAMVMLSKKLPSRIFAALLLILPLSAAGLLFTCQNGEISPLVNGIINGNLVSSFWVLFHLCIVSQISDHNHGNEISISANGISIGAICGFMIAGFLAASTIAPVYVAMIGIALTLSATLIMMRYYFRAGVSDRLRMADNYDQSFTDAIVLHKRRAGSTILQGTMDITTFTAWPLFMVVSGVSVIAAGAVQSATTLLKFVISPVVGAMTNSKNGREMTFGSILQSFGWLPWIVSSAPVLVPFSAIVWTIGSHFYQTGLASRWYGCRSIAGIAAREVMLGTGRIICLLCLVPVLSFSPYFYALFAFALGVVTIVYTQSYLRQTAVPVPQKIPVVIDRTE